MAIENIFIPTYKRTQKQSTWDQVIPEQWRDRTFLITTEEEAVVHRSAGRNCIVCPVQGTGIAPVRKWIAENNRDKRYAVLDDDIVYFFHTPFKKPEDGSVWNRRIEMQEFDVIMDLMDSWMDEGIIHCGLDHRYNIPREVDFTDGFRLTSNIFYDGTRLPVDDIDWLSIDYAEDYYVCLQLLLMGYKNRVCMRWRIHTQEPQTGGGCSVDRTIDKHNASMKFLMDKYPEFVKPPTRTRKGYGDEFNGTERTRVYIKWKSALAHSQKSTLEDMFS